MDSEFLIQLIARLDPTKAADDLKQIEKQLNTKGIKLKTALDTSASKQEIQNYAVQIQKILKDVGINIDTGKIISSLNQVSKQAEITASKVKTIQDSLSNGTYNVKIAELESQFKKLGLSQDEVTAKMKAVKTAYTELSSKNLSQEQMIQKEKQFNAELTTTSNHLKVLKAEMGSVTKFATDMNRLNNVATMQKWAENNTKAMKKFGNEINDIIAKMNDLNQAMTLDNSRSLMNQFKGYQNMSREQGLLGFTAVDKLKNAWEKFAGWGLATGSLMSVWHTLQQMPKDVAALDTALVDLRKTANMSTKELEDFYYASNDVAKQMGVTTEEILNQASAWSRLGYSTAEQATQMAKYSSMFAMISPGMNIDDATDGLVSMMKANINAFMYRKCAYRKYLIAGNA